MANGIIIIDKPHGWTSMDVCAKLRGMFCEKRIGHAGTLDPMATGVLPVFIGRATRAVEYATQSEKEYIAGIKLGVITNTQDITGKMLESNPVQVNQDQLWAALEQFRGDFLQIPPMYSAIKVKGKKLYELARKGQKVERQPRPVKIYTLDILDETPPEGTDYLLRVVCSKGTYVRTLCHDIGQVLGCGGAMSALRRIRAAGFSLEEAVTMETIQAAADKGRIEGLLLPVDQYFVRSGWKDSVKVSADVEKRLRNGTFARIHGDINGKFRAYGESGEFLGLAHVEDGRITLSKSFFEV